MAEHQCHSVRIRQRVPPLRPRRVSTLAFTLPANNIPDVSEPFGFIDIPVVSSPIRPLATQQAINQFYGFQGKKDMKK